MLNWIYFMIYVHLTSPCINRVLSLLLPAAFFAALDTGFSPSATAVVPTILDDHFRGTLLKMSRGIAVLLLIVWVSRHFSQAQRPIYSLSSYLCSRIYLHNPPGEASVVTTQIGTPEALKDKIAYYQNTDPQVNQWVCLVMLTICIGIMAATAEWVSDLLPYA